MAGGKIIYHVINKADFKNNPALASAGGLTNLHNQEHV